MAMSAGGGIGNLPITSSSVDDFDDRVLCCKPINVIYSIHSWIMCRYCAGSGNVKIFELHKKSVYGRQGDTPYWCRTRVMDDVSIMSRCDGGTLGPHMVGFMGPSTAHPRTWRRHDMEMLSALLALCEGNPPVTGGFPSQWPVMRILVSFLGVLDKL